MNSKTHQPRKSWLLWLALTLLWSMMVASQVQADPIYSAMQYNPDTSHYYQSVAVSEGISWTDANAAAQVAGGYLATIASEGENNFVFNLVDSPEYWFTYVNNHGPWLGGYKLPTGGWAWVTGELWNYTSFASGQPDNLYPYEPYLNFFNWGVTSRASYWNDMGGSDVIGFIIEYEYICYDFTCHYEDGNGDYYNGLVYETGLTYQVGDIIPFEDENSSSGYYEITDKTTGLYAGMEGQVFVDSYYDLESDNFYTPLHAGTVVGDASLGSERDYLLLDHYILNRFGIGPTGAEEVHYEADVTYAQDVYNGHREPFRTIRLNSLHRCYILLGTRHPELFDDDV